jgi:hypothetical protein
MLLVIEEVDSHVLGQDSPHRRGMVETALTVFRVSMSQHEKLNEESWNVIELYEVSFSDCSEYPKGWQLQADEGLEVLGMRVVCGVSERQKHSDEQA